MSKKILGCGDGPASFNAELTKLGGVIISIDLIYQFYSEQICERINEVYPKVMFEVEKDQNDYIWKNISNVATLGKISQVFP